jgi:hypothetical protein
VENKTVALAINGTKITGRMIKAAIASYLAHRKAAKSQDVIPHGKQTVKQLIGQNQGVSNVELTDPSIRAFERIARKYGVDYAVKRDRANDPPRFLIFFKSRRTPSPPLCRSTPGRRSAGYSGPQCCNGWPSSGLR